MIHTETLAFAWEVLEFEEKTKRKDWYWLVGIVGVVLIVIAILLQNYLFGFLILLAAFMMVVMSNKKPELMSIEVSEQGININGEMHKYEEVFAFWIDRDKNGQPRLLLLSNQRITPLIALKIHEDIDPLDLRDYLIEFIEEQEMQRSVTDRVIDAIGF